MSEEIIIDGVNVAGCSYYSSETYPYTCEVWDNECEAQNCYFKQLKRLQAENEQLKEQLSGKTFFCENCEKLARENEQLKEKVKTLDKMTGIFSARLCKKYKQALEEIREIAKEQKEICNIEGNCIDDRLCSTCFLGSGIELADDILSKISEVLK